MNHSPLRKLPIGIQSFEFLRQEGYLYVDKTALIYQLVTMGKPYFLSRPRRFGKSLLLSTLEAYFLGKRELFHGLAIEQLEENWYVHPVLHLSLNAERYDSHQALADILERQLQRWEELYHTGGRGITYSGRFMEVIRCACEQTGRRVVVLIDEYDKPLLRNFHNPDLQEDFREMLTAFYTVLKSADPYLQFVFITGVTTFAQGDHYCCGLNHLLDISLCSDYNTLCGMTQKEIVATFQPELEAMQKETNLSADKVMEQMSCQYGGYRFTSNKDFIPMHHPYSVLSALQKLTFGSHWFTSDTHPFLVEMMKERSNFALRELNGIQVSSSSLKSDRADINDPVPMAYQSGYLTIKDYDDRFMMYTLGFPNEEVKQGFLNLIPQKG